MSPDLLAAILDNECDPANPYTINMHCKTLSFRWVRVRHGFWICDTNGYEQWVDGQYVITEMIVSSN